MADLHNDGPDGGNNINSQRAKIDEYRKWMQQQQKTLETTGAGTTEIARRIEQSEDQSNHNQQSDESQMSSYMRRNLGRKSTSPLNQGRKMNHPSNNNNGDSSSPENNNNDNSGGGYYSANNNNER